MQAVETDRIPDRTSPSDDGGQGTALLALFTMALLIVVAAVWMVGALGGWWVLALAFAIHLVVTGGVLAAIFAVLREPGQPPSHGRFHRARHTGARNAVPAR
jgi:hypothetical protein